MKTWTFSWIAIVALVALTASATIMRLQGRAKEEEIVDYGHIETGSGQGLDLGESTGCGDALEINTSAPSLEFETDSEVDILFIDSHVVECSLFEITDSDYTITTEEPNLLIIEVWIFSGWFEGIDLGGRSEIESLKRVKIKYPCVITKREPDHLVVKKR